MTNLVACFGLYSLAVYTVSQRMKEVGIRKILGAEVSQLSIMLSRKFFLLVLIAFVIASPVAYYFMNNWLEGFAYHTIINPVAFVLTVLVMISIALVTVGTQAWRAATANPVDILRTE